MLLTRKASQKRHTFYIQSLNQQALLSFRKVVQGKRRIVMQCRLNPRDFNV